VILGPLTALIAMRTAQNSIKNYVEDQKIELFNYFHTQEGMVMVASLGKLFGAGAMSSVKFPKSGGNIDLFGMKIPRQWVDSFIEPIIQGQMKKMGIGEQIGQT